MRRVLEAAGLRVLVAADGVEAVEQFAKHKDEITAVVLDVGADENERMGSVSEDENHRPNAEANSRFRAHVRRNRICHVKR